MLCKDLTGPPEVSSKSMDFMVFLGVREALGGGGGVDNPKSVNNW